MPSHRGVEQLVARRAHNPKVAGSSPVPATSQKPGPTPGLFLWSERKACFLFKRQKKRSCCEANTGFWLDAPLLMVRERRRASNPVPATSQKPGQTPGLFLWSEGKLAFSSSDRKKSRVAKPTQDFGLMLPYSWSASAAERAVLSPLLHKRDCFFYYSILIGIILTLPNDVYNLRFDIICRSVLRLFPLETIIIEVII